MTDKKTFVTIMCALDKYFNETVEEMEKVGFAYENPITEMADTIAAALDNEFDPKQLARQDINAITSGSYIYEWLLGMGALNEICPTAESLYDYIKGVYKNNANENNS